MDRFERSSSSGTLLLRVAVYIPIWIDLKVFKPFYNIHQEFVYIPIWIDLKGKQEELLQY